MSDHTFALNGADSLATTLAASGVNLCLANPGTLELHFVAALDRIPGVRRVLAEFHNARMPGGRGRPAFDRRPYMVDAAVARLAGAVALVLAGAAEPIGFFAYPGKASQLKPAGAALLTLAEPHQDVLAALDELGARPVAVAATPGQPPALPSGAITPESAAAVVSAVLPEQAVVVDEAVSSGRGSLCRCARPRRTTGCRPGAARSASACRVAWAWRWVHPAGRCWCSKAMPARCTPCRRCGPWRARACRWWC
jgi:hypothetical protein